MAKKDSDNASRPDDENPAWTQNEIRNARPAPKVFAEVFGVEAAETLKRERPSMP